MKIDAYASEVHYREHITPVFEALPSEVRGEWAQRGSGPVIVSAYKDLHMVRDRAAIFMEHGSGQTYGGSHPSYAGGRSRENVRLFLCPSERIAVKSRATYPHVPAVVIGCPKMDPWLSRPRAPMTEVVGLAWHWNAMVCPEARSAFGFYADWLGGLAARFKVIGTAHPRIAKEVDAVYEAAGITWVEAGYIFSEAKILCVDNSSIGWEFLSLDRPVVWLNAGWYRRKVEHGMRFWEFADSGLQVDRGEELNRAVDVTLERDPQAARRREVIPEVYGYTDGHSTERAVEAIMEHIVGGAAHGR